MSQAIRKFEGGGNSPESPKKTFNYLGKTVDLDLFRSEALKNANNFAYNESGFINYNRQTSVDDTIRKLVEGIYNGKYTVNDDGTWNTKGEITNLNKRRDPPGVAAGYIDRIMQSLPEYELTEVKKEPEPQKEVKYYSDNLGEKLFTKLGYTTDLFSGLNNEEKILTIQNILNGINSEDYKDYDFSNSNYFGNYNEFVEALQKAGESLNDGTLNLNENQYLNRLGFGNLSSLLNPVATLPVATETVEEQNPTNEDLVKAEVLKTTGTIPEEGITPRVSVYSLGETPEIDDRWNSNRFTHTDLTNFLQDFANYFNNNNPLLSDQQLIFESTLFNAQPGLLGKGREELNLNTNQRISYMLNMLKNENQLEQINDNEYLIPFTLNNGVITIWNSTNNTLRLDDFSNYQNTELYNRILQDAQNKYPETIYPKYKEGGILKMQDGNLVMPTAKVSAQKEEEEIKKGMKEGNRSREQVEKGKEPVFDNDISTTDWIRIGAAASDLASLISSWGVGAGTIASLGFGVGSTAANTTAQIMDGNRTGWQIAKNTAGNLALDAIGLVPGLNIFATHLKLAKGLRGLTGSILGIMSAASIGNEQTKQALNRLTNGDKLTVDDWLNLANALGQVASLNRYAASAYRFGKMRKNTAVYKDASGTIQTSGGAKSLSGKDYTDIKASVKSKDAQAVNAKLKELYPETSPTVATRKRNDKKIKGNPLTETSNGKEISYYNVDNIPSGQGNPNKPLTDAWLFRRWYGSLSTPTTPTTPTTPQSNIAGYIGNYSYLPNNGGIVYFLKQGGILKALTGNIMNRVNYKGQIPTLLNSIYQNPNLKQLGNKSNWDNWYNITDNLDFSDINNVDALNNLLKINTDGLRTDYNSRGWANWNKAYEDTGLNKFFGWDESKADYYGPSTYNRQVVLRQLLQKAGDGKGIDLGNGQYLKYNSTNMDSPFGLYDENGNPINLTGNPANPNTQGTPKSGNSLSPVEGDGTIGSEQNNSNLKGKGPVINMHDKVKPLSDWFASQWLPLTRLGITIGNNTWAANETEEHLKGTMKTPLLLDSLHYGGFGVQQEIKNEADRKYYIPTNQTLTSDAELNTRAKLDATNSILNEYVKANHYYDLVWRETREKALQTENQNKINNNEVAYANAVTANAIDKAKSDILVSRSLADEKSLLDYLATIEYDSKYRKERLGELNYIIDKRKLDQKMQNDPIYLKLVEVERLLNDINLPLMKQTELLNKYQQLQKLLDEIYFPQQLELERKHILLYGRRGVKVTKKRNKSESDRVFYKAIKDSRDAHLKLMDNLSAVTKRLILKAMT